MQARDVMTEGPASVRSTAPLSEAIALFQSMRVRHLPVVDRQGEVVGILSDRDLRSYQASVASPNPSSEAIAIRLDLPVSNFMSQGIFAVRPEANVQEIADLMIEKKISAVPVIDSEGTLVGIVSQMDMPREFGPFARFG